MEKRIFLSSPTMYGDEQEYIKEAFDTNWVAPLGANVTGLENAMAEYIGVDGAVALSSGTAALHMAVKLAGIQPGDIVLCSDMTFSATVNPVSYEGGKQVFIDSERESWNMDPAALRKAVKKYPEAKAVICVNLYGSPAKLDEIKQICKENNLIFIEDAAESLGATYNGKQTGTFGDYNAISFNGNKIITTSGGGMFLSDNLEACKKVLFWSTQSREPAPHYQHNEIGYNYRMSNIVAGIGRGQIHHIDEHVRLKKKIYDTYKNAFSDIDAITMNPYLEESNPNFWLSCMLIDSDKSDVTPAMVMDALAAENIESRPIWKPMHMQPVFADCDFITASDDVCVDEKIFANGVCLPSDIKNTDDDMKKIISVITSLF
ncbi:MAG: aminotransferase class I/II-fold pyridoxal phosphate-dependent enzyme [Clostridium sp.]|nr:aminotransferase class I/II-fold pyridoxal phosphate-dependent enzyme [Clostridium sp.]